MSDKQTHDANEAINFIYVNAPKYAKAKADRVRLEEFRKVKKALLMNESPAAAISAREQFAYSHPDYGTVIEGIGVAVEAEETLKWQLTAAELRVDVYRTESANNRSIDRATQ